MKQHKFILLTLALLLLPMAMVAKDITEVPAVVQPRDFAFLTREDAQKITYEFDGHTYNLADTAKGEEHALALLKAVYENKNVPGTIYEPTDLFAPSGESEGGTPEKALVPYVDWNAPESEGPNYKNLLDEHNAQFRPAKTGLTLVLVQVDGSEETGFKIASARVLFNKIYAEGKGWVLNFQSPLSRFYIVSKGRLRHTGAEKTSYSYEVLSPKTEVLEGQQFNCAEKLRDGQAYRIFHDCSPMFKSKDFFFMGKDYNDATIHNINICMTLPDQRMKYWAAKEDPDAIGDSIQENIYRDYGSKFQQYHYGEYAPYLFSYTLKQDVPNVRISEDGSKAIVTLAWNSSFEQYVGKGNIVQEFNVYPVKDDGTLGSTPLNATLTTDFTLELVYDLTEEPQHFRYIVRGRPQKSVFNPVQSNLREITLPPLNKMAVPIQVVHSSEYDHTSRANKYSNTISLVNMDNFRIPRRFIREDAKFEFLRDTEVIATLTFSKVEDQSASYTITKGNESTSGILEIPLNVTEYIDFSSQPIAVTDNFSQEVSKVNEKYEWQYQIRYTSENEETKSAQITVSVPTTEAEVLPGQRYTAEQVKEDTDGKLATLTSYELSLLLQEFQSIRSYEIWEDGYNNSGTWQARLDRTIGDSFNCYVLGDNNQTTPNKHIGIFDATTTNNKPVVPIRLGVDDYDGSEHEFIPVIKSEKTPVVSDSFNTYGVPADNIAAADMEISAGWDMTRKFWTVAWRPAFNDAHYVPKYYRLYRTIGDGAETYVGIFDAKGNQIEESDILADNGVSVASETANKRPFIFFNDEGTNAEKGSYRLRMYASKPGSDHYFVIEKNAPLSSYIVSGIDNVASEDFEVRINGNSIEAPQGSRIFTVDGIEVSGEYLPGGIYIVAFGNKCTKVAIR